MRGLRKQMMVLSGGKLRISLKSENHIERIFKWTLMWRMKVSIEKTFLKDKELLTSTRYQD